VAKAPYRDPDLPQHAVGNIVAHQLRGFEKMDRQAYLQYFNAEYTVLV
jgi:hypothetical protein